MRWVDDTPVKKRRKKIKEPSTAIAVAAVIFITCLTLCGLLFINMPKGNTQLAADAGSVMTTATLGDAGSSESDTRVTSADGYSVRETKSLNESGSVTNKNTESKMMESLMSAIGKQTARPE